MSDLYISIILNLCKQDLHDKKLEKDKFKKFNLEKIVDLCENKSRSNIGRKFNPLLDYDE